MVGLDAPTSPPGDSGSRDADDEATARATQVVHLLRDLAPVEAFALAAWDPGAGTHRHRILASDGYSTETLDHLSDDYVSENPAFKLIYARVPRALRWRDAFRDWNLDFSRTRSAEEFLSPYGFREGASACLRLSSGEYAGLLHVSWTSPAAASDRRRETIERFRPLLADVCDVFRGPQTLAAALVPESFVLLVSSHGVASELPGRPAGPQLSVGGDLRRFLCRRWATLKKGRFLWIDRAGAWHTVELIACLGGATMIAERQVVPPYGLTHRELQVLHLVSSGASNPQIGERLFVSPRTVATHVEHLLTKFNCKTRAELAAMAATEGLLLAEAPQG